jgi:hypothetical protein
VVLKIWIFVLTFLVTITGSATSSFAFDQYRAGLLPTSPNTIREARYLYDSAKKDVVEKTKLLTETENDFDEAVKRQTQSWSVLSQARESWEKAKQDLEISMGNMDTLVRNIYIAGAQPSPLDIILADPKDDVSGMFSLHNYFSSTANYTVESKNTADQLLVLAEKKLAETSALYEESIREVNVANQFLMDARLNLDKAKLQHDIVEHQYRNWIYRHYTNLSVQPLSPPQDCKNWLVKALYNAGFRGENVRQAWAIAMRESGGRADAISSTQDYGVFQFNKPTWGKQDWWDDEAMLTREYNIGIAYKLSQGGKSWISWGLTGKGKPNPLLYYRAGWNQEKVESHIVVPYLRWFKAYPCVVQENE